MGEQSRKLGLIPNRRAAAIGLFLTGFMAVLAFRDALIHPAVRSQWLFPLGFAAPKWVLWTVNGAFYGYLLWLCFVFFRIARGKERIIVVGWSFTIVLYPVKYFVSSSAAVVIQHLDAAGMAAAFLAILDILLRLCFTGKTHLDHRQTGSS